MLQFMKPWYTKIKKYVTSCMSHIKKQKQNKNSRRKPFRGQSQILRAEIATSATNIEIT